MPMRRRRGQASQTIGPDGLVWVFGAGRTGSAWFCNVLAGAGPFAVWHEPLIGLLFAPDDRPHWTSPHFVLGVPEQRAALIRSFTMEAVRTRYPELTQHDRLIMRDVNGSNGAINVTEALPESRLIVLMRDPRDIVSSLKDAFTEGSWARVHGGIKPDQTFDVEVTAVAVAKSLGASLMAFDAHEGSKAVVNYEDLRNLTVPTLLRCCDEVQLEVDGNRLEQSIRAHSWEAIPDSMKGPGMYYRRAQPGGWRTDLTPHEVAIVERHAAAVIARLYSPAAPP